MSTNWSSDLTKYVVISSESTLSIT